MDAWTWILIAVLALTFVFYRFYRAGNPTFWKMAAKLPDEAYDWFMQEDCWVVLHRGTPEYASGKPNSGYSGPFFLAAPKLGGVLVKIYGRRYQMADSERRFLQRYAGVRGASDGAPASVDDPSRTFSLDCPQQPGVQNAVKPPRPSGEELTTHYSRKQKPVITGLPLDMHDNTLEDKQVVPALPVVASSLAEKLTSERQKWFAACLQSMRQSGGSLGLTAPETTTCRLEGQLNHIIKSFQIVHVLSFISMQGYAGNRIEEFTRLVGQHAYEGPEDWIECRPYVQRYTELKQQSRGAKLHDQLLAFAEDAAMATAMATGGPGLMVLAQVAIDMTVAEFFWRSLFLAAYAFGDKKTASELLERFR